MDWLIWILGIFGALYILGCLMGYMPRSWQDWVEDLEHKDESDTARLQREIERWKSRAWETDLPRSLPEIFHSRLRKYPELMAADGDHVCSLVRSATAKTELGKEITTITLDEVELVFLYEEWPVDSLDGEERQHGRLELSIAEEQVLALDVAHKDYGAWSAHDVSAFRDGGWVSHLRKFVEQIRTEEKKRQEDAEVERLREVRDGFGSQRD